MRRHERRFEAAVVKALDKLRRDLVRGVTDETVHELTARLSDEAITRPFQDAIVAELQAVALAGSAFGREQVEGDVFGVGGQKSAKALEVGMWELANQAAAEWALRYGYDLVRGIIATTRERIAVEVAEYVRNSETIGQLTRRLAAGGLFSPERAQMIAVTEVTRAFQQGSLASWKATEGIITGKEVRTNRDELVCPICSPKNGQVYALDDPEGDPPFHPRCILPGNRVLLPGRISAAAKSFYDGRAVEITVGSGRVLTVTENHPILTPDGYVPAKLLREGGYVFSALDANRIAAAVNPDDDHVPTAIEEVFRSLKESPLVLTYRVPAAAEDFHGDGRSIYGDVDIVYIDRPLEGDEETAIPQQIGEFSFRGDGMAFGALPALSHAELLVARDSSPASCVVCGADLLPPLVVRHKRPFEQFGLGTAAGLDSRFEQASADGLALDAVGNGEGVFGFSGQVARDNDVGVQGFSVGSPSLINTGVTENSDDDLIRHAFLARQFLGRFSGLIAPDEIIGIREFVYTGHVYDIQCDEYELYITEGVITSNCRCWTVPRVSED